MREQLEQLVHASPFVPFSMILPNGRAIRVPHPGFIWLHPDKRTVHVAVPEGGARILSVQMIVSLDTRGAAA